MTRLINAKSAPVLDEADNLLRILDYQLFTEEQNARLYSDPESWKPGDPIHTHPHAPRLGDAGPLFYEDEPGPLGNHVRPMFEFIYEYEYSVTCKICDVYWRMSEKDPRCWNCGEDLYEAKIRKQEERHKRIFENSEHFSENMYAFFSEAYTSAFESFRTTVQWTSSHMQGFHAQLMLLDEVGDFTWSGNTYPISATRYEPPVASPSPFERRDRPIELVRNVAPALDPNVRGTVHIPGDVDLSGRMVPEVALPKTDPIVIPSSGWHELSITQQRRRRSL